MLEKIKQFKKIDAHSHVGHFGGWSNVSITPEELIRQMDEYNVEKVVICTFPIEESIATVDQYPDRFIGAAWVNPMEKDAVSQIRSAVEDHGFKAVKLHPLSQSYLPNDECVFPIAQLAGSGYSSDDSYRPSALFPAMERSPTGGALPRCKDGHDPYGTWERNVCTGCH